MFHFSLSQLIERCIFASFYIVVALIFLFPLYNRFLIHREVEAQVTNADMVVALPTHLKIPSVNIDVNIGVGEFSEKGWSLSSNKAYYAQNTDKLSSVSGNTVIYGHHIQPIFLYTDDLTEGDEAIIQTDTHYTFIYKYTHSEIVLPTNTDVFTYQGPARLTLLTCNGLFNGKRRLIYFSLEKVVKND